MRLPEDVECWALRKTDVKEWLVKIVQLLCSQCIVMLEVV